MFCEKCGNRLQDGELFCPVCGTPTEDNSPMPKMQNREPVHSQIQPRLKKRQEEFDEEWEKEEKKEKATFIILGVIIVVLVAAIVAGVILLMNSKGDEENKRVPQLNEEMKEELEKNKEGSLEDTQESIPEAAATLTPEAPREATPVPAEEVSPAPVEEVTPDPAKIVTPQPTPVPTQAPVVVEEIKDYIIPDSGTRYLTNADLNNLSEWEIRVARNEIYARHGRIFKSEELASYFSAKSWYVPSISPDQFDDSYLNAIEIENLKFINNYEIAHNLNQ